MGCGSGSFQTRIFALFAHLSVCLYISIVASSINAIDDWRVIGKIRLWLRSLFAGIHKRTGKHLYPTGNLLNAFWCVYEPSNSSYCPEIRTGIANSYSICPLCLILIKTAVQAFQATGNLMRRNFYLRGIKRESKGNASVAGNITTGILTHII